MSFEDLIIVTNVRVELIGPDGDLLDLREGHNLVPTVGKEKFAERCVAASPSTEGPKYIGVGTSETAAANGDTALGSQDGSRKEVTTRSVTGAVGTVGVTFGKGEHTATLKEAGVFSASTSGTLFARQVFSAVTKGAEDELVITWTFTQS